MRERFAIHPNGNITDNNRELNDSQVVKKLNEYEKIRLRKNKEISKFRKQEEKYQRVIGGLMAFLELRINEELWWDLNE